MIETGILSSTMIKSWVTTATCTKEKKKNEKDSYHDRLSV